MKSFIKHILRLNILVCMGSMLSLPIEAQVTVDASIDSLELLIGEQTDINLEVSVDAKQKLQLPVLNDTIIKGVEIVDIAKPDTQMLNEGKRMLIKQKYTITSFDSALYYLPPFEVKVDGHPYLSKPLALKVYSIPVDTLHPDQFFGPKDIHSVSITWNDIRWIVWFVLMILVLLVAEYYLFKRYRDNKPIIRRIHVELKLPPHEQALKDIETIKADRILLQNDSKVYYTKLTDVLRNYMKERFGFNAMEMTSSEIIDHLVEIKEQNALSDLKSLFETADLAKFAKFAPLMNENDKNLVNAIAFINKTKIKLDPNVKPKPTEITVVEKRSSKGRMILLGCLIVIIVAVVVLAYLITKNIIDIWF